eukprot:TRINITY_DN14015_c0_g2_i1.p1 TRINITY_DN14015_c0_g2~~TRINITY_DN14015_c0_g2_i1.p1  ORF type:complete len:198 (+),score=-7.51 TRINITY_DN14015_c0_g2_i1:661-1254(+)
MNQNSHLDKLNCDYQTIRNFFISPLKFMILLFIKSKSKLNLLLIQKNRQNNLIYFSPPPQNYYCFNKFAKTRRTNNKNNTNYIHKGTYFFFFSLDYLIIQVFFILSKLLKKFIINRSYTEQKQCTKKIIISVQVKINYPKRLTWMHQYKLYTRQNNITNGDDKNLVNNVCLQIHFIQIMYNVKIRWKIFIAIDPLRL